MGLRDTLHNLNIVPSLGEEPPTMANAVSMTDRYQLRHLMRVRAFDNENNLAVLDDGGKMAFGFGIEFTPLLVAGSDTERQLGALLKELPPDSVVQFMMTSLPDTYLQMKEWKRKRSESSPSDLFRDMADARMDHFARADMGMSLIDSTEFYPRTVTCYLFVTLPGFRATSEQALEEALVQARRRQRSLLGKMQSSGMHGETMDEFSVLRLHRALLNPQMSMAELDDESVSMKNTSRARMVGNMPADVLSKNTRMRVLDNGDIQFTGNGNHKDDRSMVMRSMTVDAYPEEHYLYSQRRLIGDLLESDSRIAAPFCAYTTIHILDPFKARDTLMKNLGLLNKQALSESAWFRSMMGSMFARRDATQDVLDATQGEHTLVRAYTGINVYAPPNEIDNTADNVKTLWNKSAFTASPERYITLPAFLSSLPWGYNPESDKPNRGLQRAEMMTSLNASTLAFVAADWSGTGMHNGGPLLLSRRGQVAAIDLFQSETNYNFAVAASSGSGKSFFSNEIAVDFLSRNGTVRIIDVGRSYENLCELCDGQVIEYDLGNPQSINPFWGIKDRHELGELLPMFKAMITMMAYPKHEPPPWEYQKLEQIIAQAWEAHGEQLGMKEIYDTMCAYDDERAQDIADQIHSYAIGRLAEWFNGEPAVGFQKDFTILELDGLNADKELRNVVLAQTIHSIMHDMYLSSRERPKLLLIDEAWDLLGDSADSAAASEFIETAARRVRKYNGSLGTVTQSYRDYYKSDAARAALENSAWRLTLRQKSESLKVARDNEVFNSDDKLLWKMLETVNPGKGYSEIHIANDAAGEIFRFVVDPLSYWIYTTNPKDRNKIDQRSREKGISHIEAIYDVATEQIKKLDAEYGTSSTFDKSYDGPAEGGERKAA